MPFMAAKTLWLISPVTTTITLFLFTGGVVRIVAVARGSDRAGEFLVSFARSIEQNTTNRNVGVRISFYPEFP